MQSFLQEVAADLYRRYGEDVSSLHILFPTHIHNHIIFNNVNMVTGKCYQSNKKSYHKIRYQSDKLCKENNLSVID